VHHQLVGGPVSPPLVAGLLGRLDPGVDPLEREDRQLHRLGGPDAATALVHHHRLHLEAVHAGGQLDRLLRRDGHRDLDVHVPARGQGEPVGTPDLADLAEPVGHLELDLVLDAVLVRHQRADQAGVGAPTVTLDDSGCRKSRTRGRLSAADSASWMCTDASWRRR
jgi:hypothetical protein